jgi:hypothetical protein
MDGAAQKQETREGNMWRVENKGGTDGYFFWLYICSKQRRSDQGWDGTKITARTMRGKKIQQLDKS